MSEFENIIREALEQNRLGEYATDKTVGRLAALGELLTEKNKVMNLTAITDMRGIAVRHFADSLSVARYIKPGTKVIDVGCGGGFPSLPLAIAREDIEITALDSTAKRIAFVNETARELGLSNITGIAARAEELTAEMREGFDYALSRAVARQAILAELCLPYVSVGGEFIAMKGDAAEEVAEARNGTVILGGEIVGCESFDLLGEAEEQRRTLVFTKKIRKTPEKYPRDFSRIKKKPL